MLDLDGQLVSGEDHPDEHNIITENRNPLADPNQTKHDTEKTRTKDSQKNSLGRSARNHTLDIPPRRRTRPHPVRNRTRQVRVVQDDLRVRLVRRRGREHRRASRSVQISISERRRKTLGRAVPLHVHDDGVSLAVVPLEVDKADLNEPLELVTDEHLARDRDAPCTSTPTSA